MINVKNYKQEELQFIVDNFEKETIQNISKILNKPKESVQYAARKLGLSKQVHTKWTDDDIKFLKDNYINMSSEEIANHLGKTISSVNSKRDKYKLIRHSAWTDDEINFLIQNYEKMTHLDIGKKLNRTEQSVRAKCFDLNLYKKETQWTNDEINFIKNYYMEMTNSEISKILCRTENAIHLQASRLGLKKYPYHCDYHYFDIIDTEEKAYWLGFLTADGWINKNEKNNAGVTGIELQYKDINHLKKFNKSINGNYKITDRWKSCQISTKDPNKLHHMCIIRIFSIIMYNALSKLGIANDKSYNVKVPDISNELMRHYIRGYFDGDGCFCYTNKSFSVSFITASKDLKNSIFNHLSSVGIKLKEYEEINSFGTIMYKSGATNTDTKIKFLDYIYKDCNIYLDRKYKKYLKVKNNL